MTVRISERRCNYNAFHKSWLVWLMWLHHNLKVKIYWRNQWRPTDPLKTFLPRLLTLWHQIDAMRQCCNNASGCRLKCVCLTLEVNCMRTMLLQYAHCTQVTTQTITSSQRLHKWSRTNEQILKHNKKVLYCAVTILSIRNQLTTPTVIELNFTQKSDLTPKQFKLECGPMPNLMVALPNTGGALCSTPQSLADAHY